MNCEAMVGVLPGALGLPDGARTRLLVDHDGLFRVYCAENLTSTLPMSKIKGALKAAGDEALLLMDRGEGRFVALHTTAGEAGPQRSCRRSCRRALATLGSLIVVALDTPWRQLASPDPG